MWACEMHILAWKLVVWAILRDCPLTSKAEIEKSQKVTRGSHRNDVSPLTQGLRYRAACDRCAFDCYLDRWLWMTLNKFEFSKNFARFRRIPKQLQQNELKIKRYCQRQRCNPLNVLFNIMLFAFIWCSLFLLRDFIHTLLTRADFSVS